MARMVGYGLLDFGCGNCDGGLWWLGWWVMATRMVSCGYL